MKKSWEGVGHDSLGQGDSRNPGEEWPLMSNVVEDLHETHPLDFVKRKP